jgi:hypothetical protein
MWNSIKYAAIAVLGVGLAVAAGTPASAWWPGAYGNAGGCGYYGYAPAYGYAGGCGYGAYTPAYAGVYSYGWPYGTVGYGNYGDYGYAGGCGDAASGYAPAYGAYGYGTASYGYGCRARHLHGHGGYALAYVPRPSYHGNYASASNPNFSARRHSASMRQLAHGE